VLSFTTPHRADGDQIIGLLAGVVKLLSGMAQTTRHTLMPGGAHVIKPIRPDHVAIYIRWSTEDQGDGTTLAVQSEACRHYVMSQGWQVVESLIYIDEGYSGGSLERPAITRLRAAAQQGEIDCVVVFRLDRLSRSVIDTVTLVLKEWAEITHVKSAREPVDTTTAMGKQFFYMLVSYAEWERNVIRERMFSGKLRRAREGRSPGMPAPYGYRKGATPGALQCDESEVPAVRLAFRLAEQDQPLRTIIQELTRCGYPTRKGAPWSLSMVAKLLRNPIYTGTLVWGRRRLNPRFGKAQGERKYLQAEPHVVVTDSHIPPLIEPSQFAAVQAHIAKRRTVPPGSSASHHLLTGLLTCHRCGSTMQYNAYQRWAYYRCAKCKAPSVAAEQIEHLVVTALRNRYGPAVTQAIGQSVQTVREDRERATLAATRAQEMALTRFDRQIARINHDYRLQRLTAEERRTLLEAVAKDRDSLLQVPSPVRQSLDTNTTLDLWSGLTAIEQKRLLRSLLASIQTERHSSGVIHLALNWYDEEGQR
jgi:site-specific DNA recombinase